MADGPYEHAEAASALSETAFRIAEKKYQLHMEQRLKNTKNGRVRGGKLFAQPTDLSGVTDIRNPGSTAAIVVQQLQCTLPPVLQQDQGGASSDEQQQLDGCQLAQQHPGAVQQQQYQDQQPQQQQQQHCGGRSSVQVLTFPDHPGLAVFRAALPLRLQLQLMRAALVEWPEPPTRTNHTAAYDMQLRGLFDAAQAGLSLVQQPAVQQQQQHNQQRQQQQHHQREGQLEERQRQQQQDRQSSSIASADACQHCSSTPACSSCCCVGKTASSPTAAAAQQVCSCSCQQIWSASGKGPKASVLLRKLRWASLGPPYNWSARVYEPHVPHRPLPTELVHLAEHFAELAGRACISSSSEAAGTAAVLAAADGRLPPAAAAAGAEAAAAFGPNVALVNYYHPGDTLNGHKDDVERDLLQPIVTMSLGCAAVFLMGGPNRQQQPTALLLRSGDVAVLGGPARACYHGVPRVLDSWEGATSSVSNHVRDNVSKRNSDSGVGLQQQKEQLQEKLAREVEGLGGADYGAVLAHMQQCRVNVSVRSSL